MTEYLIFVSPLALLLGVIIGHWLTLRSIGHLQPSYKQQMKQMKETVSVEPDPWNNEEEPVEPDAKLEEMFAKTGLPRDKINPRSFFGYDVDAEMEEHES